MLIRKTLYTTRSGLLELPEPVPQAIIKAYNIITRKIHSSLCSRESTHVPNTYPFVSHHMNLYEIRLISHGEFGLSWECASFLRLENFIKYAQVRHRTNGRSGSNYRGFSAALHRSSHVIISVP